MTLAKNTEPAEPAVVAKVKPMALLAAQTYVMPVRTPTDHLPSLNLDDLPRNTFWLTLGRAVTLRREFGSPTEAAYVGWLVNRLPVTMIDGAGNIHVDLRSGPNHRTMFTSHTDSVHDGGGINKVHIDGKFWRASKDSALGADDGAGNAIMAYMIEAGVPGYYVFFRGEECGGLGSKWLSRNMESLFKDIDRAVAFDRAGYADVITHQAGGRCCSEEFAQALATALCTDNDWYLPCNSGVYTDTAEFTELIAECTNISVGYKNQHGDREEQDVEFLWDLAQRCVLLAWDDLPVKRDPRVFESMYRQRYPEYFMDDPRYDKADKKDTKSYGSMDAGNSYDRLRYDEDENNNDDAYYALGMLEDALYNNAYTGLIDLMADHISPDNPKIVTSKVNPWRLTEEILISAYDMIEEGHSVTDVMEWMYQDLDLS